MTTTGQPTTSNIETHPHAEYIANLRAFARFLEDHPQVPAPMYHTVYVYTDVETVRSAIHLSGEWDKQYTQNYVDYVKHFGDDQETGLSFQLTIPRNQVCTRVETGEVRHIPAQPARDEPIYTWVCNE